MGLLLVVIGLGELLLFGLLSWLDAATLESLYPGAELHRMHGLGQGLIAWVLALCIVVQLWRPQEQFAAAVLGLAALLAYTAAALLSGLLDPLAIVGIIVLAALVWFHPGQRRASFRPVKPAVLLAAVPLIVGAVAFAGLELQAQFGANAADPHAALGHYGAMAAIAATIAAATVIGSSSFPGSAFGGWLGVSAAMAFGVASILFPESASSLGVAFGLALTIAAVALGAGLLLSRGAHRAIDRAPEPQRAA
ncbi:MAG: hypothetical protein AB1736_08460 [Chloroflexota bacterium]